MSRRRLPVATDITQGVGLTTAEPAVREVRVLLSPALQDDVEGFAAGYTEIPPQQRGARHGHADAGELWLVFAGTGRAVIDDEEVDIGPGSVIYTPPGIEHQFFNTGNEAVKLYWVYVPAGEERAILDGTFR